MAASASSRAQRSGNVTTTLNLSSSTSKKVQTSDDILRQIEATMPDAAQQQSLAQRQGGLSARLQGRINEHELTYGDKSLPRQRLPRVDNAMIDRYQAARHNVLVLGAIQQAESSKSKPNTHRSGKGGSRTPHAAGSRTPHAPGSHTPARPSSRAPPAAAAAAAAARSLLLEPAGAEDSCLLRSAADDDPWGSEGGPGSVHMQGGGGDSSSGPPDGLESAFNSFKSRVSSKTLGSVPEDSLSAQPSGVNLHAEGSHISGRAGRRYNRQGSNASVASRASGASFASGLTGASGYTGGASSSYGGSSYGGSRHLGQQASYRSSGGSSSGHTLRSHRNGSVAGSSHGGHHHRAGHRKGAKKRPPKPQPGRITRAFAEFGGSSDWVSKTVLKHTLAAIIQAHWRGYYVRQRWKVNKEQLVIDEQERLEAATTHQARLQELQHKLALYQQKKLAQAAAEAAAAAGGSGAPAASGDEEGSAAAVAAAAAAAGGGQLGPPVASWQSMRLAGEPSYSPDSHACGYGGGGGCSGSDSDSGWSDFELDDVAAIKFRAVTPPWQRSPDRQQMSLQLQQRTAAAAAAALGGGEPLPAACWAAGLAGMASCWEGDDNNSKLQELRHRRICRKPEPVPLSAPAVAAAAAAGLLAAGALPAGSASGEAAAAAAAAGGPSGSQGSGGQDEDGEAAAGEGVSAADAAAASGGGALSQQVVEALLLERYSGKYARLGLPHKMPGRQRWLKMQAEAAAVAAAAAAAEAAAEELDGGREEGDLAAADCAAAGPAGSEVVAAAEVLVAAVPAATASLASAAAGVARKGVAR